MEEANHFGLDKKDLTKIALDKVVKMSRTASDNLSKGVNSLMKKNKIDIYKHRAYPKKIDNEFFVNTTTDEISSKNIIIATGCKLNSNCT